MKLRQFISCSVFYIMLLCSSMLLFSCEEEETWNPKDSSSWGYFDGEINGEKVHLQNTVYKDYINKGSRYTHSNKFVDSKWAYYININVLDKRDIHLRCNLMQFEVGTQYITASIPSFQEKDDYNAVSCWAMDSTNVCHEFKVKASRPVKLEITDIKYFYDNDGNAYTLQPKLIEGNIDAVLYHGNDSISIKGHFETK